MSNFRAMMDTQPNSFFLVKLFSLPENEQPFRYCRLDEENAEAWGVFVSNYDTANFDLKGDLSLKQMRKILSPPIWGTIPISQKMYITEGLAIANISQFCERLNNACYKKAYKRYGKRVSIVSAVKGSCYIL